MFAEYSHFQKTNMDKTIHNTFKYYGSYIWNLLPNEIKETAYILSFKSLIMTWKVPNANVICVIF